MVAVSTPCRLVLLVALAAACGDERNDGPLPEVRGALIDAGAPTALAQGASEAAPVGATSADGAALDETIPDADADTEPTQTDDGAPAEPRLASASTASAGRVAPPPPAPGPRAAAPSSPPPDDDDGPRDLTFDDLELPEEAMPEPYHLTGERPGPVLYTDDVRALDGRIVSLSGFVIPTVEMGSALREFSLSKDPPGCCFGDAGALDAWVDVLIPADVDPLPYTFWGRARIEGRLSVSESRTDIGVINSIYQIEARRTETVD